MPRLELTSREVSRIQRVPIVARRESGELPTNWKLMVVDGPRIMRRVYVLQYANGGATPHININGQMMYLADDVVHMLDAHAEDLAAFEAERRVGA